MLLVLRERKIVFAVIVTKFESIECFVVSNNEWLSAITVVWVQFAVNVP